MHLQALLGLPASLLLLVLVQAQDGQQPRLPIAVRKMGLDEGEKFYPDHYAAFAEETTTSGVVFGRRLPIWTSSEARQSRRWPVAERSEQGNASDSRYLPPFAVHHANPDAAADVFRRAADALAQLQRRQWACPTGTSSCSSIGYPNSCCPTGETCYQVEDTGLGPVGCCGSGITCNGDVAGCGGGAIACSASLGGGCCLLGYVCQGVGCVLSSSATSAATSATSTTSTTTSTATASTAAPSTAVVTVIVTATPGGDTTTRTTTLTSTPSTTETSTSDSSSSSATGGIVPIRPTLTSTSTTSTSMASSLVLTSGYCPTGYYNCLASAGGGCCQTGRDCQTTSCPPASATTTVLDSNGNTVVVIGTGLGAAAASTTSATCAGGWFLCGSDAGSAAGCCPTGYTCGLASCSLVSASSTGTVQKERPSAAARVSAAPVLVVFAWWLAGLLLW